MNRRKKLDERKVEYRADSLVSMYQGLELLDEKISQGRPRHYSKRGEPKSHRPPMTHRAYTGKRRR